MSFLYSRQQSPHPNSPQQRLDGLDLQVVETGGDRLKLRWLVRGAYALVRPDPGIAMRGRDLWNSTSFGVLFRASGEPSSIYEFWFSPTRQWSAHVHDTNKSCLMRFEPHFAPVCELDSAILNPSFNCEIPLFGLPDFPWHCKFVAQLEERDSGLAFWAWGHDNPRISIHDFDGPLDYITGNEADFEYD